MRRVRFLFLSFLVLCPAARISAQQIRNYQCMATAVTEGTPGTAPHVKVYVSNLVPMETAHHAALNTAWAAYVKSTYKLDSPGVAQCHVMAASQATEEQMLRAQENAWGRQGWEVVHVAWKPGASAPAGNSGTSMYGAAGASPPAATAAPEGASNAPESTAAYCYSDEAKATVYFSDAFDTTGSASSKVYLNAFSKMLAQKYAYKGKVNCKGSATILATNHLILEQKEGLAGKQIVETDWSFDISTAPTSAPPASKPPQN